MHVHNEGTYVTRRGAEFLGLGLIGLAISHRHAFV
jgi:hypothetical protein